MIKKIVLLCVAIFLFILYIYINLLNDKIKILEETNKDVNNRIEKIIEQNVKVKEYLKVVFNNEVFIVSVTGYHPVREQCDSTPDITADGTKIDINIASEYRYVALSRNLLKRWGGMFKYGDLILVKGTGDGRHDGIYQIRDTMHKKHKNWVDILLTPGEDGYFYYKNILIYKLNEEKFNLLAHYYKYPEMEFIN